ncbi:hypothetical protein A2U01_0111642, partial [Trifolium medium]|nr:hypothetical protein [Trifolium medium]
ESFTGDVTRNVCESLVMGYGVMIEELVCLKNPVKRIRAVKGKKTKFGWFKGGVR